MKVNYPIKYCAMPIMEQVGWINGVYGLEREDDIVCYIVAKCYLISDLTKYTESGNTIKQYEVVFPYKKDNFDRWQRIIPSYNLYGNCMNANKVDVIFDSYEKALNFVMIKNNEICKESCNMPYTEDYLEKIEAKKNEFNDKLSKYKLLEQQILINTKDMQNEKIEKLFNEFIEIEKNHVRIVSYNIYNAIELSHEDKFIVYSISLEQYSNLVSLINENKQDNIKSIIDIKQGLALHKTRYGFDNIMLDICDEDIKNMDKDTLIFYTTEPIEDLLNSYKKHDDIDLNQIQEPVLKKIRK